MSRIMYPYQYARHQLTLGERYPADGMPKQETDRRSRRNRTAGRQARTRVTGLTPRFEELSAMTSDRTILITGVTGNQGGAVAQALQNSGFHLRGLTRTPDGERAAALVRQGVDVVKVDLDDAATLRRALTGAWGVFAVQNSLEAGVEREEGQGKR